MNRDEVGPRQQFNQANEFYSEFLGSGRVDVRVEGDDLHVETTSSPGHHSSDSSEGYETQSLAGYSARVGHHLWSRTTDAPSHCAIESQEFSVQSEEHREGVIGNLVGAVINGVAHNHARPSGGIDIDLFEARAPTNDHLERGESFKQVGPHAIGTVQDRGRTPRNGNDIVVRAATGHHKLIATRVQYLALNGDLIPVAVDVHDLVALTHGIPRNGC
jgi:hypothetical protein